MIINALCDYYDILATEDNSGIAPFGYEKTDFRFSIVLTEDGELSDIIHYVVNKGDKPKSAIMPKSMKSSSIAASPVCDNLTYIFGIGNDKSKDKKFQTAKELHLQLFENAKSKEAVAIKFFFEKWNPNAHIDDERIQKILDNKGDVIPGNAAFRLKGEVKHFHECEEIREIWLAENERKSAQSGEYIAQCSITGETVPIARIHTQLKIRGAQPTGASLVSYKLDSFQSYNLDQSFNSHVSETAMFKYTTVLDYLLKSHNNRLYVGDDTAVFWAQSTRKEYEASALSFFNFDDSEYSDKPEADRAVEAIVKSVLEQGAKGIPAVFADFEPDVKFYVLGLAPNAGRVSVRYFYKNTFSEFCEKIKRYYDETQICGKLKYIKIGSLLYATINANSSDKKINPLLGGAVMRAILSGSNYPKILLNQVIMRVKVESLVNQARVAAIKAYLVRNKKEEYSVMLNEESKNKAYVLGRVFAILEIIQKNASGGSLNTTIKDKYFATACSNPSLVFPTLLKLAHHHMAKIEGVYWEKKLSDILALIEGETFPKTQNMEEQGSFILGYYQQNQKIYEKQNKEGN